MTEQHTTSQYTPNYTHAPLPEPKKKPWWKKAIVILPVATLVLGLGLGAMNRPDPVQVPGPERIVNHTEEKRVEVTPEACLTAMGLYEKVIDYSSEALGYTKDAMLAASRLDAAGIRAMDAKMGELTPKIKAVTEPLLAAKASCRAAGS
jgi:hypothetical protein